MAVPTTMKVPAYPSANDISRSRRRHYLFGYPISHSASPAFQNAVIQFVEAQRGASAATTTTTTTLAAAASQSQEDDVDTGVPTYSLCETKSIDESHLYQLVRHDPRHGGSGVTMPLKVAVAAKLGPDHVLDELDSIGRATMTVNTIVVLPSLDGDVSLSRRRMVGTNTDCLGIRHAVVRDIAIQNDFPAGSLIGAKEGLGPYVFPKEKSGKPFSAFIIGSGGTCRSAVWALHNLGLSPLYLLNRDAKETQDVVDHFASANIDLRPLRSVEAFEHERGLRQQGAVGKVACAVGAIPAFEPATADEKMVYTLAHAFFQEPYEAKEAQGTEPSVPSTSSAADVAFQTFALPSKRSFLEMCYKPRLTPLLKFAGAHSWSQIGGVEAMVEQGLAQARMWAASSEILNGRASVQENPLRFATTVGDEGPLGLECEEQTRKMVQNMSDVVVPPSNLSTPTFASSFTSASAAATAASLSGVSAPLAGKQAQSVH